MYKCNSCVCLTVSANMRVLLVFFLLLCKQGSSYVSDSQGPRFTVEPPSSVTFSNTTGARIDCSAQGSPTPRVEWYYLDGALVQPLPGLLLVEKHSLVFPPFHGDNYRQEIHSATYRCVASNGVGTILSAEVPVRAVVMHSYATQVYDAYVIRGNTAVLKCDVPSHIRDYLTVISWVQDSSFNIYPSTDKVSDSKYLMLPSGELHILNATPADGYETFRCRTLHKLTDETKVSDTAGKIIVGDPPGQVSPRIVHKASTVVGKRGEDVVIPCVAQGNPLPNYWWHRKESDPAKLYPLETNDKRYMVGGSLVLRNVQVEDAGSYVCAVNSSAGSGSAETELKVVYPLSAHMQPQHQVVDAGQQAELNCITSGFPKPTISWTKDGKRLALDNRVKLVQGSHGLRIRPIQREDQGMYQCFAKNDMEASQATAELRLGAAKPQLIYKFIQQTLQPGPYVSLKCIATGNPTPQIKWSLDGFPLPQNDRFLIGQYVTVTGDVISHVNITNVKVEDGGNYECTAVNRVGSVSHKAHLHIYGLPFIRPMPSISAVAGEPLYITCPAAGYPIDTITWEKDNRQLPVNHRHHVFKNGTLSISNVQQKGDQGPYSCEARNRQGHSARGTVDVTVMVPPEITPFTFQDLTEGARLLVQCTVQHGDLPLTISWMKDSHPLHSTQHNTIHITDFNTYSSILTISSVSRVHNGNYTCVARNPAREVAYTAQLIISVPPQWVVEPRDRSAILGSSVALHCQADGFPKPNIAWRRSPGKQPGTFSAVHPSRVQMEQLENGTLLIYNVKEEDEGHYLCEANNGIGAGLSAVIFLTVNALPRFTSKAKKESVRKSSNAVLLCEAQGDLPMQIVWKKEGEAIPLSELDRYRIKENKLESALLSELTIPVASRQDSGSYTCTANNAFGQDVSTVDLQVQDVPGPPYDIRMVDLSSRIVKLTWVEPYDGNSPITKYIIRYRKEEESWNDQNPQEAVPNSQTATVISGLQPATTYHARVSARNQLGEGEPGDTVTFTTEGEVPSGPPTDLAASATSDREIRVTWLPPLAEHRNGRILGYYLGIREHRKNKAAAYNFTTVATLQEKQEEWVFQSLRSYTQYGLVVQAFNPKGAGPISEEVIVETLESVPSASPQSVNCIALTSQSIQVSWNPPPEEHKNGIIEGYKVYYETVNELDGNVESETKVTTSQTTTLHGLRKYANYSLQVLAFTQVGDGVKSDHVWCVTEEDVPEAPANIKAVLSAPRSCIVSWAPPKKPNGVLSKYNIYGRVLHKNKEVDTIRKTVPVVHRQFEAPNLENYHTYEFWVTASTKIGEGPSTRVVNIAPNQRVPASILSFDTELVVPWKSRVELQCLFVGIPKPDPIWQAGNNQKVSSSDRYHFFPNGSLGIKDLQKNDAGNYTCIVKNSHGSARVHHTLKVQVPPSAPSVHVKSLETTSLVLEWTISDKGGSPVLGYILNYKYEYGEWEELRLSHMETSCAVRDLQCGTLYYFYVSAYSVIGMGAASEVIPARTHGSKPIAPEERDFLLPMTDSITIDLQGWKDGGCPIVKFLVGYRVNANEDWRNVVNERPGSKMAIISNLHPATFYEVQVEATNSAGSTVVIYSVRTLPLAAEATISPADISAEITRQQSFFSDLRITLPIVVSIIAVILAFVTVIICWRRKPSQNSSSHDSHPSVTLENKQNLEQREQFYAAMHKSMPPAPIVADSLDRIPEYGDDIYPYATFQVQKNPETPSRQKAFQTFIFHHDSMKRDPETMAARTLDTDEYCHVIKFKNPKRKSFRSESEEYDSLGSDSDTEHGTSSRTESSNQLEDLRSIRDKSSSSQSYTQSNIHHSRLLGLLESSTSTEPSPISERKLFLNRAQGRNLSPKKYISTKETTFTYPNKHDEMLAAALSDSRELSEAECDRDRLRRYRREHGSPFKPFGVDRYPCNLNASVW